jgi:multicomponent Na+:H+ antiporter subunit C
VSLFDRYNDWIAILLMMIGFYPMIAGKNLVKKLIGLGIFQVGIFLFFISIGKVETGTAPVYWNVGGRDWLQYTNAIPTALILTGIVVSVSTLAVALAITVNIHREYGTVETDEMEKADQDAAP